MKRTKILLFSAIGIAAIWAWSQARAAGFLNTAAKSVSLAFDGLTPVLTLNLLIQNPSNSTFLVKAVSGNLYSKGELIGNVSNFTQITVGPASQVEYPLYIRLSLLGVVTDIVKLFSGGGLQQQIEFKGVVNANDTTFPIDFKYVIG
jgi:hypothetical protein